MTKHSIAGHPDVKVLERACYKLYKFRHQRMRISLTKILVAVATALIPNQIWLVFMLEPNFHLILFPYRRIVVVTSKRYYGLKEPEVP